MIQKVFHIGDRAEYDALLRNHDVQPDIYYQFDFLSTEILYQKAEAEIFYLGEKDNYFIYPYLKYGISGMPGYFDISSPYGYAGPLVSSKNFLEKAERGFIDYCKNNNILTEFVRYHYLYNLDYHFEINIKNELNRKIVCVPLSGGYEDVFTGHYNNTNKRAIKKMVEEKFLFEITSEHSAWSEFVAIYYRSMDHLNASKFYYFNESYFSKLKELLGDKILLARVRKDEITYATAIYFVTNGIINYYLGAKNLDFLKIQSMNYIMDGIIRWGCEHNYTMFNLGGGLTMNEDDALLRFKCNFSKNILPFTIGKRIHKPDLYEELTQEFIAVNGEEKYNSKKHILQFYR